MQSDVVGQATDVDVLVRFRSLDTVNSWTPHIIFVRASGTSAATANAYGFMFGRLQTPNLRLATYVNGTFTAIASANPGGADTTDNYMARVRVQGSSLQARFWTEGTAEPTTWDIDRTDTVHTAAGAVAIGASGGTQSQYHAIAVATDGSAAVFP